MGLIIGKFLQFFFFYCDIAGLGLYTTKLVFSGKLRSVDGAEAPHFRCVIEIKNIFKSCTYQNFLDDLLTLVRLNPDISCLCSVDPDQLASSEAN